VRYDSEPGASWFRFTAQHFYCRNCDSEIRHSLTSVGYGFWALLLGCSAFALISILRSWGILPTLLLALVCIPLPLAIARWGTRWALVSDPDVGHDAL
jgi:hypothetical protein